MTYLTPEGLDQAIALALILASFATSAISGAFGLGGGVVMLGLLAAFLPPSALIAVHGWVQLAANAGRAAMLVGHIRWQLLPAFAIGTLLGVILGGQIAVALPPAYVQLAVGLFILWTLVATPPKWLRRAGGLNGFVSSVLTMFFGATGPFVAAYLKPLNLPRQDQVATHACFMTLQHGLKVAVFSALGFALLPWLGFIIAMSLAGLFGTWIGKTVLNRMTDHGYQRILSVILFVLALRLLYGGVGLLWAAG